MLRKEPADVKLFMRYYVVQSAKCESTSSSSDGEKKKNSGDSIRAIRSRHGGQCNSIQDDSLYSSSTQKQSLDSIALSRGHSLRRFHERATAADRIGGGGSGGGPLLAAPPTTTSGMRGLTAHMDLYTEGKEVCLNIFTSNDSLFRSSEVSPRLTVKLNRLSSSEHAQQFLGRSSTCSSLHPNPVSVPVPASVTVACLAAGGTPEREWFSCGTTDLDVIYCKQGPVKIFIRHKHRQRRNRLKFWRYFRHMTPPVKDRRQPATNRQQQRRASVRFYSPVLNGVGGGRGGREIGVSSVSGRAPPSPSVANVQIDLAGLSIKDQDDDLEAYMKEIKLRENQSGEFCSMKAH